MNKFVAIIIIAVALVASAAHALNWRTVGGTLSSPAALNGNWGVVNSGQTGLFTVVYHAGYENTPSVYDPATVSYTYGFFGTVTYNAYIQDSGTTLGFYTWLKWYIQPSAPGFAINPDTAKVAYKFTGDVNNINFTVTDTAPPAVTITSTTAASYPLGAVDTVKASFTDNSQEIMIYKRFLVDGSAWTLLGTDSASTWYAAPLATSRAFNAGTTLRTGARVAVVVWDLSGLSDTAYTNTFDVIDTTTPFSDTVAPTVSITSPAEATTIGGGGTCTVAWTSYDSIGVTDVSLWLTTNGTDWTKVDSGTGSSWDWNIPSTLVSGDVRIAAVARDSAGNKGTDTVSLTVRDSIAPAVTVDLPTVGTVVRVGDGYSFMWTASDNVGLTAVKISLSRDGGATWTKLDSATTDPAYLDWYADDPATDEAMVRVDAWDAAGNVAYGLSGMFSVSHPTSTVTMARALPKELGLSALPGKVVVALDATKATTLAVYGVSGKAVLQTVLTEAGWHAVPLCVTPGRYVATLTRADKRLTIGLTVTR